MIFVQNIWAWTEGRELNGTSGDDESFHHHADQYDHRIRSVDRLELHDSFDPFS